MAARGEGAVATFGGDPPKPAVSLDLVTAITSDPENENLNPQNLITETIVPAVIN